jgi:hypothetical protein
MTGTSSDSPASTPPAAPTAEGQDISTKAFSKRPAAPAVPVSPPTSQSHGWSWSPRQVRAIAVLAIGLLILACWRWYHVSAVLNEDLTVTPAAVAPAEEMFNPNTASWA